MPPSAAATLLTVTVTYCWLVTPVSGTIISLPLNVGVPAVPVPAVTAAVPDVTGLSNTKTIVWLPPAPPLRGSVVGLVDTRLSGRSKVPAAPCTLRDLASTSTGGTASVGGRTTLSIHAASAPLETLPFLKYF